MITKVHCNHENGTVSEFTTTDERTLQLKIDMAERDVGSAVQSYRVMRDYVPVCDSTDNDG